MTLPLSNRRALVCGSTSGIGLACAQALAGHGARVTLLGRDPAKLATALQSLPPMPSAPHDTLLADLANPTAAQLAVRDHLTRSPGDYTIIINNTGGPAPGSAIDATPESILGAINAQLIAAHLLTQLIVPGMKTAMYGRIINITSTSVKQPIPNLGVSNIVRPAVAAWAKCLATELGGFGITANNILPGYTSTDRLASIVKGRAARGNISEDDVKRDIIAATPAGRFGEAAEIGAAVAFLCSPLAGYINGVNLPIDGGRLGTL
ncbi:MAG: SDR family oxidoreductase [Phycisphaerales bacterium]|nr:SDR family oxidoreductase [Phycisphaerales bacterium]